MRFFKARPQPQRGPVAGFVVPRATLPPEPDSDEPQEQVDERRVGERHRRLDLPRLNHTSDAAKAQSISRSRVCRLISRRHRMSGTKNNTNNGIQMIGRVSERPNAPL